MPPHHKLVYLSTTIENVPDLLIYSFALKESFGQACMKCCINTGDRITDAPIDRCTFGWQTFPQLSARSLSTGSFGEHQFTPAGNQEWLLKIKKVGKDIISSKFWVTGFRQPNAPLEILWKVLHFGSTCCRQLRTKHSKASFFRHLTSALLQFLFQWVKASFPTACTSSVPDSSTTGRAGRR